MKKLLIILLSICLILSFSLFLVSCGKNNENNENNQTNENDGSYLVLNSNYLQMYVGETFDFNVVKMSNGESVSFKNVEIKSETEKIASVQGNTVKALFVGETNINFNVDGLQATCHIKVLDSDLFGPVISLNEGKLYTNVKSHARAYLLENGVCHTPENVTWSVVGDGEIDSDGYVTPTENQSEVTLKVDFVFNGKDYTTQKTFSVFEPSYYISIVDNINLIRNSTYTNEPYQQKVEEKEAVVKFKKINFLTGAELPIDCDFTTTVTNDIISIEKLGNDSVLVTPKETGVSKIYFSFDGINFIGVNCTVYIPVINESEFISAINNAKETDLYALVNDITLTVNGKETAEAGSNACFTQHKITGQSQVFYSIIPLFNGTLNGNGHKITVNNTTALDLNYNEGETPKTARLGGLFGAMSGTIENVAFDIDYILPIGANATWFATLCYDMTGGTLKNCYVDTDVSANIGTRASGVIAIFNETSKLENNIFVMEGSNLKTVVNRITGSSTDEGYSKLNQAIENQIIIGADTNYYFVADANVTKRFIVPTSVVYESAGKILKSDANGKVFVKTDDSAPISGQAWTYSKGKYDNRTDKLTFETPTPWEFDSTNGMIKLNGNKVFDLFVPEISFNEDKLYTNVKYQASAYLLEDGVRNTPENVMWSVVGDGEIDSDGFITPTENQREVTLKADFVFNNKNYTTQKTFSVFEPCNYVSLVDNIKLIRNSTYTNEPYQQKDEEKQAVVKFNKINFITGAELPFDGDFTTTVTNDIINIEKQGNDSVVVTPKATGVSKICFTFDENNSIEVDCTVYIPVINESEFISAMKEAKNTDLYALVNDITLTANGKEAEAGSNAYFTRHTMSKKEYYSIIPEFKGTLYGNGYNLTVNNTTALDLSYMDGATSKNALFAGLFGKMSGTIENVAFDIDYILPTGANSTNFAALCYDMTGGTLKNCYVDADVSANIGNRASGVIATFTETSKLENNIFNMKDSNIRTVVARTMGATDENDYAILHSRIENQIIIGAYNNCYFVANANANSKFIVEKSAVYESVEQMLSDAKGKVFDRTEGSTTDTDFAWAIRAGAYVDRTEKLEFATHTPWVFDSENGTVSLNGKVVLSK